MDTKQIIELVLDEMKGLDMWFTTKTDPTFEEPSSYYELDEYGELTENSEEKIAEEVKELIGDGAVDLEDAIELWINERLMEYRIAYTDSLITKFEPKPIVDQIAAHEVPAKQLTEGAENFNKRTEDKVQGDIIKYKGFVIEVDEVNTENNNETIVFIYKNKQAQEDGDYIEQVSLNTDNLEQNVKDYIDEMYDAKKEMKTELYDPIESKLPDLARDIQEFMYNFDTYDYNDNYMDDEDAFEDVMQTLISEQGRKTIIDKLVDIEYEDNEESIKNNAASLIERIKQFAEELEVYDECKEIKTEDVEYITQEELDNIDDDFKTTVGETIRTAGLRGEDEEETRKLYKDLGYDESDPMIQVMTDKGSTLKPVKIKTEGVLRRLKEENNKSQNIITDKMQETDFDPESKYGKIILKTSDLFNKLSEQGFDVQVSLDNGESQNTILLDGGRVIITITDAEKELKAFISGNIEVNDEDIEALTKINEIIKE